MAAEYSQGKDFISSVKLNFFHYFLKQLTGYLVHPSIQLSGTPCRIADMGTQTAFWAIDIAEDIGSNAMVDAYDLSDKFFPPRPWLPSNLRLEIHDICTPFPMERLGTYDLVHFRLFLTMTTAKLNEMLETALTLLKPGGYIQWVEHDKTNLTPITSSSDQSTEAVEAFIKLQQNPFPGYRADWVNEIAPMLTTKGMRVIVEDRIQTKRSMLSQAHDLHLLSLIDVAPGLSSAVDSFKEQYFGDLADNSHTGVSLMDGFIVVVAQKPF